MRKPLRYLLKLILILLNRLIYWGKVHRRSDLLALIDHGAASLEIGPFDAPLLSGAQVEYFDVLSQSELQLRAQQLGRNPAGVPRIQHISATGDLTSIQRQFKNVLSVHVIEHQPDLIKHLQAVESLLSDNGRYFLIIPDKRYCFDANLPESNLAQVVAAHLENRSQHSLASVLEHRCLTTHNNPILHLLGLHGKLDFTRLKASFARASAEFHQAENYLDVHAWYLTPNCFQQIMQGLCALELTQLVIEQIYPTRLGEFEFYAILRKRAN